METAFSLEEISLLRSKILQGIILFEFLQKKTYYETRIFFLYFFSSRFDNATGTFTQVANGTNNAVYALCIRGTDLFVGGFAVTSPQNRFDRVDLNSNTWNRVPAGGPDGKR